MTTPPPERSTSECRTRDVHGLRDRRACRVHHRHHLPAAGHRQERLGPVRAVHNGLGDLLWAKIDWKVDAALGGATFTVTGTAGAATGFSATVADNETGKDADPDNGEFG